MSRNEDVQTVVKRVWKEVAVPLRGNEVDFVGHPGGIRIPGTTYWHSFGAAETPRKTLDKQPTTCV